jgi:alpha-beta hydrolase superfamily lysophospholipase
VPLRLPKALVFSPDQLFRVGTDDGSAIALGRYHPRGERRFLEPVLLGHSLATNRFNLDFDERYSLARFLARHGFEAWVLELRGHGLGGSADGSTFDIEATFDVTAALRAVHSTGAERVFMVGHSRGGLLPLAHLTRSPEAPIAGIVALGSPFSFEPQQGLRRFVELVEPLLRFEVAPLAMMAKAAIPIGLPPEPVGAYLLNRENVDGDVIRQALRSLVSDVPHGVLKQFVRWVRTGRVDGEDGFDYLEHLGRVRAPVLLVAGVKDLLAPPEAAHLAARHLGGPVTELTVGRFSGFSYDAGHGDLVLGRQAPDELFPRIAAFLEAHATLAH